MSYFNDETDDFLPTSIDILSSLDGDVNSQGIKIKHRAWLDMGSAEWQKTPDEIKSAAYQAAQLTGWEDQVLVSMIAQAYPHLKDDVLSLTIDTLRELAKKHPLAVEEVFETKLDAEIRSSRPNESKGKDVDISNIQIDLS